MYRQKFFCEGPRDGGALSGIGGLWNDISGTSAAAAAAQRAGDASLAQQRADRSQAMELSAPSDMEMQQLQQAIALNGQDIARKQKILDTADPALMEAGRQALALMTGQDASTLKPLQHQREAQRAQLQSTLAQQLGPDYATSSAGIQALNNFDRQTSDVMATQQNQTLGQYMNWVQGAENAGSLQNNIGNSAALAKQRGDIGTRQANALQGFRIDPSLAYAGDAIRAKGYQNLANLGIAGADAYFSGGASAAAGTPPATPSTPASRGEGQWWSGLPID